MISGDDFTALDLVLNGGSGVISVVAGAFPREFSKIITLAKNRKHKRQKTGLKGWKILLIFYLKMETHQELKL